MRFGVCTSTRHMKALAEIGYDYIEYALCALADVDDDKLAEMLERQRESGIRVESCNNFFPGDFKLYATREDGSEDVDGFETVKQNVRDYVENAFAKAQKLGITVTVLGSAGARTIPDGIDRAVAERQFLQILRLCGEIGEKYGIVVTVEPLNYDSTNFINTVAEGLAIAKAADHPSVQAMIDFYHHAYNGEPMAVIGETQGMLAHVHLARAADRKNPTLADEVEIAERIEALRAIGYDGRISLECHFGDDFLEQARESYLLLKKFK